MAVQTTEEKEPAQWSYLHVLLHGTLFEELSLIMGTSRLERLPQFFWDSILPATTLTGKKLQTAKSNLKVRDKRKKKDIGQQLHEILSLKKFGDAVTRHLPPLWRFWLIALFISMLLPHQAIADEFDCSIWGRMFNDGTLDDQDVFFNVSGKEFKAVKMNLFKLCSNSFAYAPVQQIILSFNNVSFLPANLFRGISNLQEVELQGNPLREVPSVFNSTKTIRYLNLADTKIGNIPKYSINGMSGLKVLDLSRTEITDVPEDIFDMSLRLVHLSQTKLVRLPLPPPMATVAFNVTLVGTHGNELSIQYPNSGRRKLGINITGIETLTCENAKTEVASSYCVLAGKMVCNHGSFDKINILLKGKSGSPPSCTPNENATTHNTVTAKVVRDASPNTPAPNRGTATPCPDSCGNTVPPSLVIGIVVISLVMGAFLGGLIVILVMRKCWPSFSKTEDIPLQ